MSSRLNSWDGDGTIPEGLWYSNFRRTLKSQRGQKILRELEAALLALPEHRLIEGDVCDGKDVCAVGALGVARRVQAGASIEQALEFVRGYAGESSIFGTAYYGRDLGMAWTMAWEIAVKNDEDFGHLTPEQRWEAMLAWVRSQIKQEA